MTTTQMGLYVICFAADSAEAGHAFQ
jgi:hypothetical protein